MARPKADRTKRTPMGSPRKQLSLDAETLKQLKGRVPRWINDDNHGQRLQQAISGGYDFLYSTGTEVVGDGNKSEDKDRRIRKMVGSNKDNTPLYAYLMAIDEKFYKEDQALKEKENMKVDHAIKGGAPSGLNNHGIDPNQGSSYVKNVDYQP
jgi:hypothetical protein